MRILMVGDIVGNPGRSVFARTVTRMRADKAVDVVVANAENAAGGKGITRVMAEELFGAGADVLTLGDHAWDQREFVNDIKSLPAVVRPANFAPGQPGKGFYSFDKNGVRVTVMVLVGRVFMNPYDCPFRTVDAILTKEPNLGKVILVDMHAEATSEKIAMSRHLDGRVTAVCGTHTHVQTADERIMPGGTAAITDLGMTGPKDSVIGRSASAVMTTFLTGMPSKFEVGIGDVELDGVLLDVDETTGRCRSIKRIREKLAK
jgi:metallophosphoesterase (TIGR00282 family)